MKIEIKSISVNDLYDFEEYIPDNPVQTVLLLTLEIGIKGNDGINIYFLQVSVNNLLTSDLVWKGKQRGLFLRKYDKELIRCFLDEIIEKALFDTFDWSDFAVKLSKDLSWEYENHTPAC